MPTYEYRREDGSIFEIDQSIKADALKVCPTTGQKVTRIISGGTGLIFKGTGFYLTDYARKKPSAADGSSGSASGKSNESATDSKSSPSSTESTASKKETPATSGSTSSKSE